MKEEFSAGGVVYKKEAGATWWLVGKHSGYHKWVLPKGMIEMGETKEQAAEREVKEEAGIQARIVREEPVHIETYEFQADYSENQVSVGGPERRVLTYQESGGKQMWVRKTVTFFLMEYVAGDVSNHSFEMEAIEWLPSETAIERLAFAGERTALLAAQQLL